MGVGVGMGMSMGSIADNRAMQKISGKSDGNRMYREGL